MTQVMISTHNKKLLLLLKAKPNNFRNTNNNGLD